MKDTGKSECMHEEKVCVFAQVHQLSPQLYENSIYFTKQIFLFQYNLTVSASQ